MKGLLENIRVAFQSLYINKSRSFLTMLGIIIGVGAVVAMMAIGTGAQQDILKSVQDIGSNLIIITPGGSDGDEGFGSGHQSAFTTKIEDQLNIEVGLNDYS